MIKSLLKKEFKIDTTRDVGLDLLRVIALLLMVSIHYARAIPTMDMLGEILKFIGESAPAFFFFAFGVTLNIFLKKTINERIIRLILFFYVAMSHNIYTCFVFNFKRGTIFLTEFLFFLWLCQVIFFIIEFQRERSYIFYISFFLAFFAVISMTKLGQIDQIFKYLIQGPFPIFPWIAFVLFGFIYSRSINELASNKPIFALLFLFVILVTAFPLLFFKEHGMSLFLLNKWPLSAGYIFVFGVLSIFIRSSPI